MTAPFRCSAASIDRSEPLYGTASTVPAFLLIEATGPWGVDAVRDCRLLGDVCEELLRQAHHHRVRPLLIRKHGRYTSEGIRIFTAYADPTRPWLETTVLAAPVDLLDLDLAAIGGGTSPGLTPVAEPIFCVCTHGRHDACCAEQGRPVAAAMAAAYPDHTWEVSHIGGDRFAGNVLVLPDGLYYGRVGPTHAAALAARHLSGQLDLAHLRGRSAYGFAVQAAEVLLRTHLGVTSGYGVRLVSHRRDPRGLLDLREVDFAVDPELIDSAARPPSDFGEQVWRVRLQLRTAGLTQLTCSAERLNAAPVFELHDVASLRQ